MTTSLPSRARRAGSVRPAASEASPAEAETFRAQVLTEMAGMSVEDGLVMQIHPGSFRNHNRLLFKHFGPDMGADIPTATNYVRDLKPLLDRFGNDPRLTLILFLAAGTARTLAARLDDHGLGAAMGEVLLHPALLHRAAHAQGPALLSGATELAIIAIVRIRHSSLPVCVGFKAFSARVKPARMEKARKALQPS